ncbi:hypothetical protein EVAR_76648_1 [Eumeta japonica]|uniref:RNA-directed DNA polymerase from mobile element jockey n=1 Tax=Eumeta variegata TaxID=151549 RepID=A0A4C1T875_EUMVA|nr:hypothetical protein EVAR_76648_1 [Eumeta japonica]
MRPIRAGVPQGSTLCPLHYSVANSLRNILPRLQRAIDKLTQWLRLWRIDVNPEKLAPIYFDYSLHKVQYPDASERSFDIANSHPNPLLVSAVSYESPPSHHFCRKSWNVLINPPDDLTVEVEKLLELNKMAID